MANLLFVIHGMGVHEAADGAAAGAWAGEITGKLDEIAAHYEGFDSTPFTEHVEIVPITYDRPFRELLAKWHEQAEEVRSTILEERIRNAPPIIDWLAEVDGEKQQEFFWSHVVDVFLYEFFNDVAKQIRLTVIDQILNALAAARDRDPQVGVSFLAHSLGTAVLHDSLALLSHVARDSDLMGPGFPFNGVFMLANVGRVLEDDFDGLRVYDSVVCPRTPDRRHYFRHFWNVRHSLDPIPAFRAFAPAGWDPARFFDVRVGHISHPNVHGFVHYLEHPDVHRPLIQLAAARSSLTPISGGYRPGSPGCVDAVDRFTSRARSLMALIQGQATVFDLIKAAADFLATASDAWDSCRKELASGAGGG